MMIKGPYTILSISLGLVILISSILFVSQNHVHFTSARETAQSHEDYVLNELSESIPSRLTYAMGTSDTKEVIRVAKQIVNSDYVYSIQVLDVNGNLITYQVDSENSSPGELSIASKTINIIDDRVISLDELDSEVSQSSQNLVGKAIVQITRQAWQERTEKALFRHQVIFFFTNSFVVVLLVLFILYLQRYIKTRIDSLGSLRTGEFQPTKNNRYIAELNILDEHINKTGIAVVQSLEEIKAADAYKRTMLEFVSHELRQPLNSLGPVLQLLKEQTDHVHEFSNISHLVNICSSSTDQLIAVLDELVDVTLMDSGTFVYQEKEFSLEAFFDNLYMVYQAQNKNNLNFSIRSIRNSDCITDYSVITDEAKLIRVFSNLLSNAFKFTSHGNVLVEWEIQNEDGFYFLHASVADTGCGISHPNIANAFKMGFRENEQVEGKGIGLALVGSLIKFLSGSVSIQSKRNLGTKISFRLPIKISQTKQEQDFRPLDLGMTAVVLDDISANCFVLKALLSRYGVSATTFTHPSEAITFIRKNLPDLVFVDYSMPIISGIEVIEIIKPLNLHVICVTAHVQPSVISILNDMITQNNGLGFILKKPISSTELENVLETVAKSKNTLTTILEKIRKE